MDTVTRWSFRSDAVLDFGFGVLAFVAPWADALFALLDLANPQPALFTQFAGILLIGYAYLLWITPDHPQVARHVGLVVGIVNVVGVVAILGWLLSGQLGIGMLGTVILLVVCSLLIMFAVMELRYARRTAV